MKRTIVTVAASWILLGNADALTTYVSQVGTHVSPFSTWETAATNIQAALDVSRNNDTVLVTNGHYVVSSEVYIYWKINLRSVNGPEATIIDGNWPVTTNRCVAMSGPQRSIEGFTIMNGCADDGGGIEILNGGSARRCIVRSNRANLFGGGVAIHNIGTVDTCLVEGNVSLHRGGGVECYGGGTVINCTIVGNSAYMGGGVANRSDMQDGLVVNTIIWSNTADIGANWYCDNQRGQFAYCCSMPTMDSLYDSGGNVAADPLIVNLSRGNYRLQVSSPCVGSGTNMAHMVGALDLTGNPRITGMRVDMGCYALWGDVLVDGTFGWKQRKTTTLKGTDIAPRLGQYFARGYTLSMRDASNSVVDGPHTLVSNKVGTFWRYTDRTAKMKILYQEKYNRGRHVWRTSLKYTLATITPTNCLLYAIPQ